SRGGCSCAGPYGHRLLGIDIERSQEFEREIARGCEGIKPGWVRVNFNYFISDTVFRYIVQAVELVAEHGWKLVPHYRFTLESGLWHHEDGAVEPPLRLTDVHYDADGRMTYPHHEDRAPEEVLAGYLEEAVALFASLPDAETIPQATDDMLGEDLERLRWFDLPAASLR
ncbi:MAG: aminotransferase, partial [Pseudolysinimonas sp.]